MLLLAQHVVSEEPNSPVHFLESTTCDVRSSLHHRRVVPNAPWFKLGATSGTDCAALCEGVDDAGVAVYYAPDSKVAHFSKGSDLSVPGMEVTYRATPYIEPLMEKFSHTQQVEASADHGWCECRKLECAMETSTGAMKISADQRKHHDMGKGGGLYILRWDSVRHRFEDGDL